MPGIKKEFRKPVFRPFKPAGIGDEKIFLNFKHTSNGKNCQTSALHKLFSFYDFEITEELLFGIGSGLGFIYWHTKNIAPPFSGGMNSGKFPGLIGRIIERFDGNYLYHKTSSVKTAHKKLKETLHQNQPAFVCVDMAYVDYFGVHEDQHFGQHMFLIYGIDEPNNLAYISDRFNVPVTLSLTRLQQARGSMYPPFPAMNRLLFVNFPKELPNLKNLITEGINENIEFMLNAPLQNFGLSGIIKWSKELEKYTEIISTEKHLLEAIVNHFIYIETGGTGGSLFRKMYSRFLEEAFEFTDKIIYQEISSDFQEVSKKWTEIANLFLPDILTNYGEIRKILVKDNQELEQKGNEALEGILKRREKLDYLMKEAQKEIITDYPKIVKPIIPLLEKIYKLEKKAFQKLKCD